MVGFSFTLLYIALSYIFPGEIVPELAPYKITLAVGVIGLLVSFGRACTHGRLSVGRPQVYYLLALTIVISLSVLWADRWFGGALDAFQDFGVSLTTFFLVIWNVDTLKKLYVVIGLMVILSLFLSIQGIAAFHYGYKKEQLIIADVPEENSDEDPETAAPVLRIRGFGIMNDPNDLALGLMTSLPLLMLAWRKKVLRIVITTAVAATLSYGIYLTHSRGAALSVLVIVFTAAMPRMGKIKSAFATLLLASALLAANISGGRAMTSEDDSAAGRIESWSEGIQMLKENPVLGVGYHNYVEHNRLTAHNSFVLCFAELGLLGFFCWMGLLVATFRQLKAILAASAVLAHLRRLANALRVTLFGFLTGAFFLSRTYIPLLYLLIGLGVALFDIVGRDAAVEKARPAALGMSVIAWTLGGVCFMYAFVRLNTMFVK